MSGTESVTCDNGSLVFLRTCNCIVRRGNLRGCGELVEGTVIGAASLEGVSDYLHVL